MLSPYLSLISTLISVARAYDTRQRLYTETDSSPTAGTLYSYTLGFQGNSSVSSVTDSVTGASTPGYDTKNRMTSMAYTAGPYSGLNLTWTYDSFGNRLMQTPSGTYSGSVPAAQTNTYGANNQIVTSTSAPSGVLYDAGGGTQGNITNDGTNQYHYDAEGRICAVYAYTGSGAMTAYVYDGDGNRVAKEALTSFSCDRAVNGFTLSNAYIVGLNGEQLEEADANGNEVHSNTFANGQLLYTYDDVTSEWTVALNDWLGTKRVQVDPAVLANVTSFQSLPFGDGLTSNGYDATEQHFTGKDRDQETGNDYFGARYYSSNMGRFTSPDFWGNDDGPPDPTPYGELSDPQSLNLYSYVGNNPLTNVDDDGHDCVSVSGQAGIGPITLSIASGTCDSDSGVYVNGTIDTSSLSYNGSSIGFSYTPYSGALTGTGVIQMQDPNGGFDPGSLGAAVFGAQTASVWNNAAGAVNMAGNAALNAAGLVFPLESLAVNLLSGGSPNGAQLAAGGLRKKPGSLGEFGSTARENKIARDIAKALGLSKDQEQAVHTLLQEGSQMRERPLTFKEGLDYVGKALGMIK